MGGVSCDLEDGILCPDTWSEYPLRLLLGHKSVETTITFYAEFEALTARRIYAEHILERRQRTAAAPAPAAW